MAVNLSNTQKDEIRRLTQLANRRIKATQRAYEKAGMEVLPTEVVGGYQTKERWNTPNTPISRSVQFESRSDYVKQLKFLRSFEVDRPGIKEYTEIQREKTLSAVETSLGVEAPEDIETKLSKLSAPELSAFWNKFSDKASKMGMQYSSDSAMTQTMAEFFPEDAQNTATGPVQTQRKKRR